MSLTNSKIKQRIPYNFKLNTSDNFALNIYEEVQVSQFAVLNYLHLRNTDQSVVGLLSTLPFFGNYFRQFHVRSLYFSTRLRFWFTLDLSIFDNLHARPHILSIRILFIEIDRLLQCSSNTREIQDYFYTVYSLWL